MPFLDADRSSFAIALTIVRYQIENARRAVDAYRSASAETKLSAATKQACHFKDLAVRLVRPVRMLTGNKETIIKINRLLRMECEYRTTSAVANRATAEEKSQ